MMHSQIGSEVARVRCQDFAATHTVDSTARRDTTRERQFALVASTVLVYRNHVHVA